MDLPESKYDHWKAKFIDGLPPLFAERVRKSLRGSYGEVQYSEKTYGQLIVACTQEGLALCNELKLARQIKLDKLREKSQLGYFCVYFEPQYSVARTILTRISYFISIIDDTYDIYGMLDELTVLTEAIESLTEIRPDWVRLGTRSVGTGEKAGESLLSRGKMVSWEENTNNGAVYEEWNCIKWLPIASNYVLVRHGTAVRWAMRRILVIPAVYPLYITVNQSLFGASAWDFDSMVLGLVGSSAKCRRRESRGFMPISHAS
ncbi:hypothetical protein BC332_24336 [Capsicum chinense]|nr:hypothetical protein BC332_24336 [Capsicum chinense]